MITETYVAVVSTAEQDAEHARRAHLTAQYICQPEIMGFIARNAAYLGASPHQVGDIVGDVLFRLWRNPSAFDESTGTMPAGVLRQTTRWSTTDLHRYNQRRPETPTNLDHTNTYWHPQVRDHSQPTTTAMVVHEALSMLPDKQAQVLRLMFLEGKTVNEVAALTGDPIGTIKSRSSLGQKALRQVLAEHMDIHSEADL